MVATASLNAARTAERSLLGTVLRYPDALDEALTLISADDFGDYAHRLVFTAAVELWNAKHRPDAATVAGWLLDHGHADDVPVDYVAELLTGAGTHGNVPHYAAIIADHSKRQQVLGIAERAIRDASDPHESADDLVARVEREIQAVAENGPRAEVFDSATLVRDALDRANARAESRGCLGLRTRFIELDRLLGGLRPGELYVIGARPSVGKTAKLLNIVHGVLTSSATPTLLASLEMSRDELMDRFLSLVGELPGTAIRNGSKEPAFIDRLLKASDTIRAWPLYVDDSANQTALKIAATARRMKRRNGLGLVVVDYLQLMLPEDRKAQRHEQIGAMSRRLKLLARELSVPVVVASQLNRATENRTEAKPRLSDLRESGSIEQDADTVILLHKGDSPDLVEVNIAKQRNGPTGEFRLYFRRSFSRFENYAEAAN